MPGTLDQFKVYRTLGTGASCKVKLGEDMETGRKVAIKMMSDSLD
jgi:serine/threonine protein kinase